LGGDPGAADALLRRHHSMIHAICRRLTGNEADALDATQEALLAIVKGLPRYDGRAKFSTWAYRVATNACLDELRRRKRRPVPVEDDAADRPEPTAALDDQVSQQLEVDDALARLPEEYRAAVVLRDLVGMDYADIASTLGIPPGTVRSRIARGRRALARLLGNPDHPTERPTPQP
ncbi:MAG: sigma-70 family RNA polymerase sigma factor, partial [Actinomycetota bacterium]